MPSTAYGAALIEHFRCCRFVGDGDEVVYANVASNRGLPGSETSKAEPPGRTSRKTSSLMPDEATQTERERMGMDDSGEMDYESVVISPEGRMVSAVTAVKKTSRDSHQLTSVALVNEVFQHQQRDEVAKKPSLRKQCSNSSIHSSGSAGGGSAKGPPPPYKQPPPPPPSASSSTRPAAEPAPTYANVQIRHSGQLTSSLFHFSTPRAFFGFFRFSLS